MAHRMRPRMTWRRLASLCYLPNDGVRACRGGFFALRPPSRDTSMLLYVLMPVTAQRRPRLAPTYSRSLCRLAVQVAGPACAVMSLVVGSYHLASVAPWFPSSPL